MNFIDNDESNLRNIASVLPISADSVPFFWCGDEDVSFLKSLEIRGNISSKFQH
jgi:hypothetical protein